MYGVSAKIAEKISMLLKNCDLRASWQSIARTLKAQALALLAPALG